MDVGFRDLGFRDLGFRGEVAALYQAYRRGYPPPVVDAIVGAFGLDRGDIAVDVGCGTGQLTRPLAARLRAVIGLDPEPDMLTVARRVAAAEGVANVAWTIGGDADLPAVAAAVGPGTVGVVTAAFALHWMSPGPLFAETMRLVRPGGGFAVVTNGRPLWLQDSAWSVALRDFMQGWLGQPVVHGCGSDEDAQQRYRSGLADAGFEVTTATVAYDADMDFDHLLGGVLSTFSVARLPTPGDRERLADGMREAVGAGPFTEHVDVRLIFGRRTG